MSDAPSRSHGRVSVTASRRPSELMGERPVLKDAWHARVVTLFPDVFPGVLGASLTGRALQEGVWQLHPVDLRTFGEGRHLSLIHI